MCTKEEAEKIIESKLNTERLKKIILKTSVVAWENVISPQGIDKWLANFDGKYFSSVENEQKLALWMLAHFTYYSDNDVRVLCKCLFNLILHQKLIENVNIKSFDDVLDELLTDSVFVGLGNASESGRNILYYFRQENKLSKDCFEINKRKYKNLIFIDDMTMSGTQACEYAESRNIEAENIYAGFLIASDEAKRKIARSSLGIKPIATMILDNRDKAFSHNSFVFSDTQVHDISAQAKEFCKMYGSIAVADEGYMANHPLGFKDGQYLIGFEYNTPDNTLPIFWGGSNGWQPIFRRYGKICNGGKESAKDGRKYY